MDPNNPILNRLLTRKTVILVLSGILALILFNWFATHGVVEISVTNPADTGEITYDLTHAVGEDIISEGKVSTNDKTIKKIVNTGNYQVAVSQDKQSYLAFIKAKGFLRSSKVSATLQGEQSRRFIGDNPGECMNLAGSRLISVGCYSWAGEFQEHLPADADIPTYSQNFPSDQIYGIVEGVVSTKSSNGSSIVLLQDTEGDIGHFVQEIRADLSLGTRYRVPATDKEASFAIAPYKDGVLVYDTSKYREFYYYSSISGKPERIPIGLSDTELSAGNASIRDDSITVLYSNAAKGADGDDTSTGEALSGNTEVGIYQGGKQVTYSFEEVFTSATACGIAKLCMISDHDLHVYDISGKEPELLFEVPDVTMLTEISGEVMAVTGSGILAIDVDRAQGYVDYRFGTYTYCGIQRVQSNYLLCVADPKGNKAALFISRGTPDTDEIDKKVLSIGDVPGVSIVSTYGSIIHIVPEYGEPQYDPAAGINVPNPDRVKAVDQAIKEAVDESGIDKQKYTIMNGSVRL